MLKIRLHSRLFWTTLTLLLIAVSRFMLLPQLTFDQDEVWSVWQTFGSLQEIIARTPFDWPAGYYLLVGLWRVLAGYMPFSLRVFSALWFMMGCAFTYQFARKLFKDEHAAWLVMLSYAALGYVVYLSVLLRAYAVIMALLPFGFILVMRYFEKPSLRRAVQLGLLMAAMFYLTLSAVFPFAVFGGFSLFLYGRRIWRWVFPGLVAFIAATPELLNKMSMVTRRTAVLFDRNLPPVHIAVAEMFGEYVGTVIIIWIALVLIASIMILFRSKQGLSWRNLFIILWIILGPVLLYYINSRTGFFKPRYGWWIALAIALWLGYGLSHLPRMASFGAGIVLVMLMFLVSPEQIADYKEPIPDFEPNFAWLAEHYIAGDVVVVDPSCGCMRLEVWDYYERVYFPNGLNIVLEPQSHHRRVWYIRKIDHEDIVLFNAVKEERVSAIFSGGPAFFTQLYVGAPDPEGILFENGLRFHGYEVLDNLRIDNAQIVRREGSSLRIRLWWSVDEPLTQEYSIGIQVFDPSGSWEGLYAQNDAAPQAIYLQPNLYDFSSPPNSMILWEQGQLYIEERIIELPYAARLQRTQFTVFLTVYQWWDGLRIPALETNGDDLLPLFDFTLMAW